MPERRASLPAALKSAGQLFHNLGTTLDSLLLGGSDDDTDAVNRRLPLYKMTPDADVTGTTMAAEPLPVATAVQRARRAVDKLPDDPWAVPMRPEDGYVSLGVSRSQYSKPPVPEDKAVNRALAEKAKEAKARREARWQRKDRKRKKLEAENRERAKQGLSPLPTPESFTDPDGSDRDGGARSPSPLELPIGGPAPAAVSGGGGEEVVDLGTPPSTVVPSAECPSGAATAVPEETQGRGEAPSSTVGPASEGPSGAASAALEEPQDRGEAPERPSAVEEAPARGPEVEVPQVEPVSSTGGEEASRVTPRGEAVVSAGGEVPGMAPQGEAGATTGGEVPGAAPVPTSRTKRKLPFPFFSRSGGRSTPSLAPTKALKIGPSSSPHSSSQLLGPANEVVQDFVAFFDTQAELQVEQQPREEAPRVLEELRPPQLLEAAAEPHAEVARPEEATPVPGEALRVEEPSAAPVEADAAVVPPHEGGEGRTHGGGFPHLKELAEALGVGAPVTQGRESGEAAPLTLIVAPPGPAPAWSYGAHARGSRFVDEAVAEEHLWEVQSSHGQDVRRALRDILCLHDEAGKVHQRFRRTLFFKIGLARLLQELRNQAFAKNDQIAELLLELRRLSGALEARERQLDDLRGARDRAVAQGREKGEVIARLEVSVSALRELVQAASAAYNEIAGAGLQSGSSLASRLRALGGHFTSRVKEALLLGVRKALGVVTTHYQADLSKLAAGYVVADDLNDEEAVAAMEEADAAADGTARVLAGHFEGVLFPGEDGGGWDDLGGGGDP
nr:unnamed protein product [Digitaria exilis]